MVIAAAVISSAKQLTASFSNVETVTHVEIGGIDFGVFESIEGLNTAKSSSTSDFTKISFKRDFVTDPSLYLWAKNNVNSRDGLKDVHLVKKTENGEIVERMILKLSHPLSWSVESANSSLGGFHETVEIAVQTISQ